MHLGRARAAARSGDVDARRLAYEALLGIWKDADSDIPIVRAARHEYRRMGVPPNTGDQSSKSP
jgi:eukaryotic-like serine/threonine-protein kinase